MGLNSTFYLHSPPGYMGSRGAAQRSAQCETPAGLANAWFSAHAYPGDPANLSGSLGRLITRPGLNVQGSALHPCMGALLSCRLPSEGQEGGELTIEILYMPSRDGGRCRPTFVSAITIWTAPYAPAGSLHNAHPPVVSLSKST